jgi:hypothetical protein
MHAGTLQARQATPVCMHGRQTRENGLHVRRNIMNAVDNVLRNVKPPLFWSLKMYNLKFGSRAPEFVSMQTYSVTPQRIVLHARMRFVGTDLQATILGRMPAGRVYAGAHACQPCARMPALAYQMLR